METLKIHLPVSGEGGLQELKKIAGRFEEKCYAAATSQKLECGDQFPQSTTIKEHSIVEQKKENKFALMLQPDYLRKISLKMLTMDNKSQNTVPNKPPDGGGSVQSHSVDGKEKTSSSDVGGGDRSQNVLQGHSSTLAAWCERLSKRKCSPTKEESAPKVPRTASPLGHSSAVDKRIDKAVPQRCSSRYGEKEMGSPHFPQGELTISCPISFSEAKELGFPPPFHFMFDPYDTRTGFNTMTGLVNKFSEGSSSLEKILDVDLKKTALAQASGSWGTFHSHFWHHRNIQLINEQEDSEKKVTEEKKECDRFRNLDDKYYDLYDKYYDFCDKCYDFYKDFYKEGDPKSLKRDLEKAMDEIAALRDKNSSLRREVEVSMDLTAACMEKLACKHKRDILSRFPDMDVSFISSNLQFITDQHKQSYQSQRPLPETSSTGGDWQEEIKVMKEMHFNDLNDMYQKIILYN
ncbi:hypothetical protein Tsubulata_026022 [Turnera subulata]|uniref:Mediator complex subunit 15 KIX domain-containing protein n=1 Tax=Turnera subulata TaxID=218843 RepID=A0A9Q0JGH4_9ROSI|nr:hypothetical protein Tsubulata_026022 [Turnera subulata]